MCVMIRNFGIVESNPAISFSIPANSTNLNERAQLNRMLAVADSWKARLLQDKNQLQGIESSPQNSFTVLIAGSKQGNLINSFLNEATIAPADLTDKYRGFLDSTVKKIQAYARKTIENAPENIKEAANDWIAIGKIWKSLKCPPSILTDYPKCALFLHKARILTKIIGYQNSSHDLEMKKGIRVAEDGHPLILFLGEWTRVEDVENLLVFNQKKGELVSKDNPEQVWNYFPANPADDRFPGGLVPVDRFRAVFPVHKLSSREYDQVAATGKKFFETNPEVDPGQAKPCFLQIFSTRRPAYGIPSTGIYENLNKQIPSHIAIRFIDSEGKVYSPSYEMNETDGQVILSSLPYHLLATSNVSITALDYEEFRNFDDRTITTIPITEKRLNVMLDTTKELTQANIRFNYLRQNCSSFAKLMLSYAGYQLDNSALFGEILWSIIPPLKSIPVIGPALDKVKKVAENIFSLLPTVVKNGFTFMAKILFYVPGKIGLLIQNVLFIRLFGAMEHSAVQHDRKHPNGYEGLENFTSLIGHWTEVFSDKPGKVSSAALVMEWQRRQPSTVVMPYEGTKFYITPEAPPAG